MAISANNPRLSNQIKSDVPEIQQKEAALLKMDPTNVADLEVGSKRLTEISSGNWQFQTWNGSQWVNVGKLKMDVDTVDGYDASITPKANTVAVRGSDGKLQDSITGNAATADSAATLTETLVVSKGGTGATTSEQARKNLGVPPTSHASANTTYGISSESVYGHAKASSDAPAQDTDAGAVGTKTSEFARGDHSHKKVLGTSTVYGQVKLTDNVSDGSDASSSVAASAKAVKEAYDKAADAATTVMTGATASAAGKSGNVPAPQAGQQNCLFNGAGQYTDFLRIKYLNIEPNVESDLEGGEFRLEPPSKNPDGWATIIDNFNNCTRIFAITPDNEVIGIFTFNHYSRTFDGRTSMMPVGFVYVQYSGQPSPSEIWGGSWENISHLYAGLFFRAEGGAAAAFGGTQGDAAPNITGWDAMGWSGAHIGIINNSGDRSGALSEPNQIRTGSYGGNYGGQGTVNRGIAINAARSDARYGAANEFRPVNSTIRIWKCVG